MSLCTKRDWTAGIPACMSAKHEKAIVLSSRYRLTPRKPRRCRQVCLRSSSMHSPAGSKEILHQCSAIFGENAGSDLDAMVQFLAVAQSEKRLDGAEPIVVCTENHSFYPSIH